MSKFYCGLDLGQANDYSAFVVVEKRPGGPEQTRGEPIYAVRHIHRWMLGTPYPAIVSDLQEWFGAQLHGNTLVIDGTGVGRAVVDMVRAADLKARIAPFAITCGLQPGEGTVPKKDLVAAVQALLQTRRLVIADLPLADTLTKELEAFRAKVTADRNETFAAWRERDHDDLVLALALAVWYADRRTAGNPLAATNTDPRADLPAGTFGRPLDELPAGIFG